MQMKEMLYGEGMKLGRAWLIGLMQVIIDHLKFRISAWHGEDHSEATRLRRVRSGFESLQQCFRACETQDDYIKVFIDLMEGKHAHCGMSTNWDPRGNVYFEDLKRNSARQLELVREVVKAKRAYFDTPCERTETTFVRLFRDLARGAGFPDNLTLGNLGREDFKELNDKYAALMAASKEVCAAKTQLSKHGVTDETLRRMENAWGALRGLTEPLASHVTVSGMQKTFVSICFRGMTPADFLARVKEVLTGAVETRIKCFERTALTAGPDYDKWEYCLPLATVRDNVNDCKNMHDLLKVCEDIHGKCRQPREFVEALKAMNNTPEEVAQVIRTHSEK